ncbi:hypothetical protein FP371_24375 [Citrobacter freundii]|uniref:TraE/TraK family type IV conjugative transfer system protein n=1 Tax=Gammaproteobacteria TaxID=1236 RepID=UPI0005CFE4C2|nr:MULTISPECIES: TraE/TraK family type IV conjugative transfer system protein [Gammaproteobacteria]EEA2350422.1 hypothetical protein [Salmonella enterica subsp. enterica serovar Enteritidis]EEC4304200.1 hypothetical protein [Salmonella enterica subsp. enterica serovar Enteritidis]EEN2406624.1 hypothetical protein [Salmonella enterica subsp. enterica serovar Enteritidis]EES8921240.1 hypothetical protein [Escherichia coli]EES9862648.1 hypothetical protein [Escherichia coli]
MLRKPKNPAAKIHTSEAMNNNQKEISDRKLMKTLIVVTMIVSGLTYQKVNQLETKQKVVIVPYGAKSSEMLVTGESASTGYMRMFARLIITDYGSVSRASVDNKFAEILSLVYPDRVEALRVKLNERAKYFKQFNSVSQIMEIQDDQPMQIIENPEGANYETSAKVKYRFEFSVEQKKIIGEKTQPSETQKFKIDYTLEDGRIWILDI